VLPVRFRAPLCHQKITLNDGLKISVDINQLIETPTYTPSLKTGIKI
jgi:hypothetical protein